ncbi:phosphonate C-P lyase system protein PhnH, partial [Mesorhizobium sp. M7A.T.Ca.TU.009.02.1.1]
MDIAAQSIEGGFADPVFDAQTVFRAVMDAMARPGSVQPLPAFARPPAPLSATAGAIALALCDNDTPLWLDQALQASAAFRSWLGFHTGAPVANTPADAHFAFIAAPAEMMSLDGFSQGTQDYPD